MVDNGGFSLIESRVGVAVWSAGLCYGMYSTYLGSKSFCDKNPDKCYLEAGWFLNQPVDRRDDWKMILFLLKNGMFWFGLNLIGAEIVRKHMKEFLAWWYLCVGMAFITLYFHISLALFFLAHPIVFFIVMQAKSRSLLWLTSIVCFTQLPIYYLVKSTRLIQLGQISFDFIAGVNGWIALKCLSYSLDYIEASENPAPDRHTTGADPPRDKSVDKKLKRSKNIDCRLAESRQYEGTQMNQLRGLLNFMAYNLYIPLLLGPVIVYKEFEIGMAKEYQPWTTTRMTDLTLSILHYLGWALVFDIVKHYVHYQFMVENPEAIYELNSWAILGIMYYVVFDFMMVYVVAYGLPSVLARAEQFNVPSHPICLAHVQMPTKLWRYIDRGLYLFMIKYIYFPLIGNRRNFSRKLMASFVTFCFIYVYHGVRKYVFLWTLYTFIAVTLEATARAIGSTKIYQQWEVKWLSPLNARRIYMVMMTPLEILPLASSMYFHCTSEEFGDVIGIRVLTLGWYGILVSAVLVFCRQHTTNYFEKYGKTL